MNAELIREHEIAEEEMAYMLTCSWGNIGLILGVKRMVPINNLLYALVC